MFLIVIGIAMLLMSHTVGGSDMKDFMSGVLFGISVGEILVGVYCIGRSFFSENEVLEIPLSKNFPTATPDNLTCRNNYNKVPASQIPPVSRIQPAAVVINGIYINIHRKDIHWSLLKAISLKVPAIPATRSHWRSIYDFQPRSTIPCKRHRPSGILKCAATALAARNPLSIPAEIPSPMGLREACRLSGNSTRPMPKSIRQPGRTWGISHFSSFVCLLIRRLCRSCI